MDSPTAIIASITGNPSFIAAIFAFVYFRYNILSNDHAQMTQILESVSATIEETSIMRDAGATVSQDEPEDSRRGNLILNLYLIEVAILGRLTNVYDKHVGPMNLMSRSTASTWGAVVKEAKWVTQERYHHGRMFTLFDRFYRTMELSPQATPLLALAFGTLRLFFSAGVSRKMMRWYRVREFVLKKMQERETVRSRLLFRQVSATDLLARQQRILIDRLVENETKLELKLSMLHDSTSYIEESIQRLVRDNEEIKSFLPSGCAKPTQQDPRLTVPEA